MKRSLHGRSGWIIGFLAILMANLAMAGEADIVGVKIIKEGTGTYRFDVTVRHGDEGSKHYADKWDVVAPNGSVLGTRVLAHPHKNEQPFTRSLMGVSIPENVNEVTLRAHDSVHKTGGAEMRVEVLR